MGIKLKMSLKQTLDVTIKKVITEYTQLIANTYNLDTNKLLGLWNDSQSSSESVTQPNDPSEEKLDPVYLFKCKKPELKLLCKQRGLRCTGTKAQLIGYLHGKKPTSTTTKVSSKTKPKPKTKDKDNSDTKEFSVLKNMIKKVPVIAIRKNQFGNHEHPETHLVFDNKLKKVIGVQADDGNILELNKEDIDLCNKFKFSYVTPMNLDSHTNLEDEKVEELDDEELEEEFEEFEEEVLEDDDEDDLYEDVYEEDA